MKFIEKKYNINNYSIFSSEYHVKNAKSNIIIMHGFRGYSGPLTELAKYFVQNKFSVFMFDFPYHGRSSGKPKTYFNNVDELVNITNEYINIIKISTPSLPLFVLGHSLGGLITCIIARTRSDITGGIAIAPGLVLKTKIVYWFYYLLMILLFFFPKIFIPCPSNHKIFPNDELFIKYHSDPFMFNGNLALNSVFQIAKTGDFEKDTDITIPFYIEHGDADSIVDVSGSRIKSLHLKNSKSKYIEYNKMNHLLFTENNYQEQFACFVEWINKVIEEE
ncbi:monoglyceride lipase, putative [Entamoeba dispar SAW760]|uniref:Monoglyceride lipase, putative n=1 Tax=Entamoeba dispar (strain ATCC PRA-260 / SAW760) TaxID=370354 RepID=B0EP01_ENTDS|nr:monoglyceride lipase, putative [Entamoeba dispar SAW760]EDR23740.1 monoglyceride lipase, putative [Entamoeba dispar SAW760]|eukprot:EDR23740.1 monoglyceride lipase, putative [Entamoeba dispar SAW760]